MLRSKPPLIIATRLGWGGETGVHRHIETLMKHAPDWEVEPVFVSPWTPPRLARRVIRVLGRVVELFTQELAHVWVQGGFSYIVHLRASRVLRRHGGDGGVLYAQDPATAVALLRLRKHYPAVRIVLCVHYNGSESAEMIERGIAKPGGLITRRLARAEKRAFEGCDAVVCSSDYTRADVLARLRDPSLTSRVYVVPHVIELNAGESDERSGATNLQPDTSMLRPRLITIGTLEPRKNHQFLIELLACLRDRGVDATLTIVGQGPLRTDLEEHAYRRGVLPHIDFAGLQLPAAPLIARHHVYVHGARMESFGMVLVEALARGRPVAAPLVGALPEIFRPDLEGVVLELGDVVTSAERLQALLEDASAYRTMCENARARYESEFFPENCWASGAASSSTMLAGAIHRIPRATPADGS
jgi:glycosyltransferase involved in cell wall biosynthesis